MDYESVIKAVENDVAKGSGGSYSLFFDMLYDIRLLKYSTPEQLKKLNPRYDKLTGKFNKYCELGFLKNTHDNVYIATDLIYDSLKVHCKNYKKSIKDINLLPKQSKGLGDINELNNTDVFIQAIKLPDYLALLYPHFPEVPPSYIEPDALLVLKNETQYKLVFLEIEAQKPDWENHLYGKSKNYLRLSNDILVFKYWLNKSEILKLPKPDIKTFCFSVWVIGKTKFDFGNGFIFKDSL
jgi:hypothetical protein